MGAIYRAILRRIEQRGYDVFREVVRIPRPRRAAIAAVVWARTMLWPGLIPRLPPAGRQPRGMT
jgi:hypothetical protein